MKRLVAVLLMLLGLAAPAMASDSVHIVPGSSINLVARDGRIPVTVMNPSSTPLEVTVYGAATSFRLEVLESQKLTIPGNTSAVAELPVRAIANGPVSIRVWLEINGRQIGEEQLIDVSVNYDVELFLLVSLAVAMFSLIVVGVVRTVVKLARSRGE
ncbi:DUF6049 family protein [Aquiluna sp. KACHI24]|uniref:DUF6049 family protein n=1 Tax=Aquiluna sp. KACHI24 TaxID=2968831 RepID=UPI00220F9659|nr:DUF6049 family protein [Aquiluna sp. KACHI24]BDQ01048.1 hypothetical protein AKACHI_13840 [Aquiluna sp. KACHI24]